MGNKNHIERVQSIRRTKRMANFLLHSGNIRDALQVAKDAKEQEIRFLQDLSLGLSDVLEKTRPEPAEPVAIFATQ